MKGPQRDAFRIHHMVQACNLLSDFLAEKQLADLVNDRLLSSAVERQFEIIGEAASHISEQTQLDWPTISWRQMKGMRNIIAHEYFRPDYTKIWNTAIHIIPAELPQLQELLAELEAMYGSPDASV